MIAFYKKYQTAIDGFAFLGCLLVWMPLLTLIIPGYV